METVPSMCEAASALMGRQARCHVERECLELSQAVKVSPMILTWNQQNKQSDQDWKSMWWNPAPQNKKKWNKNLSIKTQHSLRLEIVWVSSHWLRNGPFGLTLDDTTVIPQKRPIVCICWEIFLESLSQFLDCGSYANGYITCKRLNICCF